MLLAKLSSGWPHLAGGRQFWGEPAVNGVRTRCISASNHTSAAHPRGDESYVTLRLLLTSPHHDVLRVVAKT